MIKDSNKRKMLFEEAHLTAKSRRRCVGVNLKNWVLLIGGFRLRTTTMVRMRTIGTLMGRMVTSTITTSTTLMFSALDSYYVEYLIIFTILSIKNI